MTQSATHQRNAVSEGMALGIAMCGRTELPWDKVGIDLAFSGAWREWPHSSNFPQVSTDLRNGSDPIWIMTRADFRKQVWNLYWDTSGPEIVIHRRESWAEIELDHDEIAHSIDEDVSAERWKELAEDFLSRLDR